MEFRTKRELIDRHKGLTDSMEDNRMIYRMSRRKDIRTSDLAEAQLSLR